MAKNEGGFAEPGGKAASLPIFVQFRITIARE
jgi:hypothetical protein